MDAPKSVQEAAGKLKKPGDKVTFTNEEGHRCVLIRIDKDEMKTMQERTVQLAADRLQPETFNALKMEVTRVLADEPRVSEYEAVAKNLLSLVQDAYDQIGQRTKRSPSNAFYTHCKHINPEWYGKAQTFMSQVKALYTLLNQIEELWKTK